MIKKLMPFLSETHSSRRPGICRLGSDLPRDRGVRRRQGTVRGPLVILADWVGVGHPSIRREAGVCRWLWLVVKNGAAVGVSRNVKAAGGTATDGGSEDRSYEAIGFGRVKP